MDRVKATVAAVAALAAGAGGYLAGQGDIEKQVVVGCEQGPNCVIDTAHPKVQVQPVTASGIGNGNLATSALAPITGGHPNPSYPGTGELAKAPAAAWNAVAVRIHDATGAWIDTNGSDSAYRPYARQVYWRSYWCSVGHCENAAVPGTSNHGIGWAADVPVGTSSLLERYGAAYGWKRSCSDAPWESWHWHWCGGWSGRDPGPYGSGGSHHRPPLKIGSHGKRVHKLTHKLRHLHGPHKHRYMKHETNYFGAGVKRSVQSYQRDHHLTADGIVGRHTQRALRRSWKRFKEHK